MSLIVLKFRRNVLLQVRSISESKDDFSNGSATNSASDDERDDDEDRDGTIRLSNRQFFFDIKQLHGSNGQTERERVKVERLSRNLEPALEIKNEVKEVSSVPDASISQKRQGPHFAAGDCR